MSLDHWLALVAASAALKWLDAAYLGIRMLVGAGVPTAAWQRS